MKKERRILLEKERVHFLVPRRRVGKIEKRRRREEKRKFSYIYGIRIYQIVRCLSVPKEREKKGAAGYYVHPTSFSRRRRVKLRGKQRWEKEDRIRPTKNKKKNSVILAAMARQRKTIGKLERKEETARCYSVLLNKEEEMSE